MAGVELEETLAAAVDEGLAGAALRAGLRGGIDSFHQHMAEQFIISHRDNPVGAYVQAALVLVAEHDEHGIIGALLAYPPTNVVNDHLAHIKRGNTDGCSSLAVTV
ncbi:hypothetical protein [Sphaerisporangium perillae]|uniref:hypothetical protein n=1 Tax=Sphaerisporangium perillae TaxID=2935860 RepID=UPI00200D5F6E|nr:hypothetical protein [Sphaerisporangium perillae]